MSVPRIFKIAGRVPVVESPLRQSSMRDSCILQLCRNSSTCIIASSQKWLLTQTLLTIHSTILNAYHVEYAYYQVYFSQMFPQFKNAQ